LGKVGTTCKFEQPLVGVFSFLLQDAALWSVFSFFGDFDIAGFTDFKTDNVD
jgi:hypothetical protein